MLGYELEFSTNGMQVTSSLYEVEESDSIHDPIPAPSSSFFPKWEAKYFNSTNGHIILRKKCRTHWSNPPPPQKKINAQSQCPTRYFRHTRSNFYCFHIQLVACCDLSVFLINSRYIPYVLLNDH